MPIQFTVLLLFDAAHGSLAEIETVVADMPASGRSQWLWIDACSVTAMQLVSDSRPSQRVFDRAVLALKDTGGELRWPSGRCETLSIDPTRTLRPAFRRLLHQHLN